MLMPCSWKIYFLGSGLINEWFIRTSGLVSSKTIKPFRSRSAAPPTSATCCYLENFRSSLKSNNQTACCQRLIYQFIDSSWGAVIAHFCENYNRPPLIKNSNFATAKSKTWRVPNEFALLDAATVTEIVSCFKHAFEKRLRSTKSLESVG